MLQVNPGFARLLATENIGVAVDSTAHTAMFDVKRRVLTMPNWDCSERMKDMLIGHECAHAIFTDATDMEVLLRDVFGSVNMVAKDYLNVVEDIRIDKLIQRKYAGLRRDYRAGYAEMRDRDFFGMGDRDPNTLKFIDRLNCHFKGFAGDIQFDADEMVFVNRAENTETFEEVCDLAREIYDWCMENEGSEEVPEQNDTPEQGDTEQGDTDAPGNMPIEVPDAQDSDEDGPAGQGGGMPSDDTGEQEGDESGKGSGEGVETKGEGTMESAADAEDDGSTAESTTGSGSGDGEEGDENDTENTDADAPAKGFSKVHAPAPASTQRAMDENVAAEAKVETPNGWRNENGNYDLPLMKDIHLDNIIVGHKEVIDAGKGLAGNDAKWEEFQKGAKATVTNLAQMFERKKAAAINARTQVAKTGRLDMTALHKYKMTEDIFLRNKVEVKGKNHGIVMYVDWSGSMDDCIAETAAQTAITAMFCKKVGIPFRVYAFSTYTKGERYGDVDNHCWGKSANGNNWRIDENERDERSMCLSNFSLIELFSDKMKKADWDRMGSFLMCIGDYNKSYDYPGMLHLGGTPLNESIVAAMKVAGEFRKANGIDVLNSIWITDGCGGDPFQSNRVMVQQKETGRNWSFDATSGDACGTNALFRMYKDLAGGNLIGIFLDSKKQIERNLYYGNGKNVEKTIENFKKDGFIEQDHSGYDTYFLMDKKIAVYTSSEKMDALPENASTTRVINAFRKDLGKRTMSRPLLNTFTDKIAKEIV
tara:strand:- start:2315 stop:4600 length:2286 start_codon:yes stop_codon:yes gene_type:complete